MNSKLSMIKAQMLATCTSIYDEESMTSLELAARTACKVNEVVKLTNMLLDNIEELVQEQVTAKIKDLIMKGAFYIEDDTLVIAEEVSTNA